MYESATDSFRIRTTVQRRRAVSHRFDGEVHISRVDLSGLAEALSCAEGDLRLLFAQYPVPFPQA